MSNRNGRVVRCAPPRVEGASHEDLEKHLAGVIGPYAAQMATPAVLDYLEDHYSGASEDGPASGEVDLS